MKKISEIDLNFLIKLSSLYEALTHSAVNPVTINYFSEVAMFYDAYGEASPRELEFAEELMKKRLESKGYIKSHHKYHSEFLKLFYDIDENINTNNRIKVAEISENLADKVKEYIFEIVKPHNFELNDKAYLFYPVCYRKYGFYIRELGIVGHLIFNKNSNYFGAKKDLNKIIRLSKKFSLINERIPINKIATQEDTGIGIMDTSIRGRNELNVELLRRVGFDLENLK